MSTPSRFGAVGRGFALLVTNAIKIGGLWIAIRTALSPVPNAAEIGLAAFMMAGAQVSEDAILKLVGRMFGSHEHEKQPPTAPPK